MAQPDPKAQTDGLTPVPLLDLKAQYASIREEIQVALNRVIDAQAFILGPEVAALESEIAAYAECQFAVGVSSGTDALLAALMAIHLQPGDEVITSPYTFFSTVGVIARLGAVPILIDIDPDTFNIDPACLESAITERTRAIIPVHLFGQVADMDPIMNMAATHGIKVIEDAAQAIGADYLERRAGSIGDIGCFSFYPTKNLGGFGDGGMVVTNDEGLAHRLRLIRSHGFERKYHSEVLGGNFRLDALQAAVLRVKLEHLDDWTHARQQNADIYRSLFKQAGIVEDPSMFDAESPGIVLPKVSGNGSHIYNQFVIRSARRDQLRDYLTQRDIGTEIYYPLPLHLQESFRSLGYRRGDLPHSEIAADQTIALPIYPELTQDMIAIVVQAVADFHSPSR